jgi:hypothetical protein
VPASLQSSQRLSSILSTSSSVMRGLSSGDLSSEARG